MKVTGGPSLIAIGSTSSFTGAFTSGSTCFLGLSLTFRLGLVLNGLYEEAIIGEAEILTYTNEELELLAHLIFAEAGSDWCSDKMQQYTGSVVLNRITSPYFPNNMYDVIYQKGQYSVTRTGAINKTPNERTYNVARFLLENGSILPSNVVFQSQHIQGDGIYEKVQNMYFCYKN